MAQPIVNPTFSVNKPFDYATEQDALMRRQKYADILNQEAMQPLKPGSYNGIEAPISPLSGLAKILQGAGAGYLESQAAEGKREFGEQARSEGRAFMEKVNAPYRPAVGAGLGGPGGMEEPDGNPAEEKRQRMAMVLEGMGNPNPRVNVPAGSLLTSMTKEPTYKQVGDNLIAIGADGVPRVVATAGVKADTKYTQDQLDARQNRELDQKKFLADRAFGQLSAYQRHQVRNDAARLGLSLQEYMLHAEKFYDETGKRLPGAGPGGPPSTAPRPTATPGTPTTPATPPRGSPSAASPAARSGLSPRQQRELAEEEKKLEVKNAKILQFFNVGMKGVEDAFKGFIGDPLSGRLADYSSAEQIAEGAIAQLGPILKSIFREKGEGSWTDNDQLGLMQMAPSRKDRPDVVEWKLTRIREIVTAKLGLPSPGKDSQTGTGDGAPSLPLSADEQRELKTLRARFRKAPAS